MIRHFDGQTGIRGLMAVASLTFACLSFALPNPAAASPVAFSRTITDIEAPGVEAKVLDLKVEASRQIHIDQYYYYGGGSQLVATIDWDHSLSGQTDDSLTPDQRPEITVQRNPTTVSLTGKVVTEQAEGDVLYKDIEYCQGGKQTTKSALLDVSLNGFYQSGTSSASGNPEASLTTENLDPWSGSCGSTGSLPPEPTSIQTFSAPTTSQLNYVANIGGGKIEPQWSPTVGDLKTTADGCTPEHCDFTITGSNTNTASQYTATATSEFRLRIRLEYPKDPSEPTPEPSAPDTRITKRPGKLVKTRSGKAAARFAFKTNGPGGTKFKCRLDKGKLSPCSSPFKRKVGAGRHRFAVVSVYRGKADPSPAVYKWTVKKIKRNSKR